MAQSPARWARSSVIGISAPYLCRFWDAGDTKPVRTLGRPASKKRQGTKSRSAGPAAGSRALWGFQVGGTFDGGATVGDAIRMRARGGERKEWKRRSARV